MSLNTKFEAYKLERELKKLKTYYTIKRYGKNKFGEPDKENPITVCSILGLYHEENGYVKITTGETTQIRNKKQPRIMALFSDISKENILPEDFININNKVYKITDILDIQNWGIISDISLEVVDNGK